MSECSPRKMQRGNFFCGHATVNMTYLSPGLLHCDCSVIVLDFYAINYEYISLNVCDLNYGNMIVL
jgi:hypothetical protein